MKPMFSTDMRINGYIIQFAKCSNINHLTVGCVIGIYSVWESGWRDARNDSAVCNKLDTIYFVIDE